MVDACQCYACMHELLANIYRHEIANMISMCLQKCTDWPPVASYAALTMHLTCTI